MGTSSMSIRSKHDWLTLPLSGSSRFAVPPGPLEDSEDIQTRSRAVRRLLHSFAPLQPRSKSKERTLDNVYLFRVSFIRTVVSSFKALFFNGHF